MKDTMKDKTVLITGANSGIGKVAATRIAEEGATVVMVSRNRERGETALAEIKAHSGNEKVELMVADLSSMAQVRVLASDFKKKHHSLHVLLNNAGGIIGTRQVTWSAVACSP